MKPLKSLLLYFFERASTLLKELLNLIFRYLGRRIYLFSIFIAVLVYGLVFSYFTVLKHNVFGSYAWDLGVFNQAFYNTLYNGRLLYYTTDLYLNPSGSYFAIHVSPILFLVLPFYALSPSPATLLVIKSFILALGAYPLYLIAKELLKSDRAAMVLAIVYLVYPPLQGANWFDFQPQVFLPLLLFYQYYFMLKRRWKPYFLTTLLTLMVEEHVVLAVLIISAYFLFKDGVRPIRESITSRRMSEKLASVATIIICIIYFLTSIRIKGLFPISPEFMERYKAVETFSVLGVEGDPLLFPVYILLNPGRAFQALMYDYHLKFLYIILLYGPLLFLPFRSKVAVCSLTLLSMFLLSNYRAYYMVGSHYPLYILAFIFIAAVDVLKRLDVKTITLRNMLIVSLFFMISTSPITPMANSLIERGLLWCPGIDFSMGENVKSLHNLVNIIPTNASVLTQNHIFPHVSNRINAYVIPPFPIDKVYLQSLINRSEYVLIDFSSQDPNTGVVLKEITQKTHYGSYALASEAVLFKHGYSGEPMFLHYSGFKVFSAYKDLLIAPYSEVLNDSSSKSKNVVLCPKGSAGTFVYGPYTYLIRGSYRVTYRIKIRGDYEGEVGTLDVSNNKDGFTISLRGFYGFELRPNEWTNLTITLALATLKTDLEFRVSSNGKADIYVDQVIVERVSTEANADFGSRTYGLKELLLSSGFISEEGFFFHPHNLTSNFFWHGPYNPIPPGSYRATFFLKASPQPTETDEKMLSLDITSDNGLTQLVPRYDIYSSSFTNRNGTTVWRRFTLEFTIGYLRHIEFRGFDPSKKYDIYLGFILLEKSS